MRWIIVAVLLVAFVVAKVAYVRRSARLAGPSQTAVASVPASLVGPGRTWLVFSTRYCASCGPVAAALEERFPADTVRLLRVEEFPTLADDLAVRTAPTVMEVAADGVVLRTLAGAAAASEFQRSLSS